MTIPFLGVRWPATEINVPTVITYSFADERLEPFLTAQHPDYPTMDASLTREQENSFQQAIKAWEQVAGVDFVQVGDSPYVDLRVGSATVDGPQKILAMTGLWNSGSNATMAAISFDRSDMDAALTSTAAPEPGELSFYRTALHELGHVLGLDHSAIADDLMYPYTNRTVSLSAEDVTAVTSLYGPHLTMPDVTVAMSASQEEVQKCYIAYYGRPADPGGLAFWSSLLDKNGGSPGSIINSFTQSPESQALYANLTSSQVVTTLYEQLLGRAPEEEGLQYWTTQLESGNLSRQNIMMTLLNSAYGVDAEVVDNKLAAAAMFTGSPNNWYGIKSVDLQDVRTWLAGVTTEEPYQAAVSAAISAMGLNSL